MKRIIGLLALIFILGMPFPAVSATAPDRQRIAVPRPGQGADLVIQSFSGCQLDLGFDLDTVTARRSGNDLIFQVDSGGKVTFKEFFAVDYASMPTLRQPDGTVVPSNVLFAADSIN